MSNNNFNKISYNNEIVEIVSTSGGTIILNRDNVIVASEVSEILYRELLENPNIYKIDVLPLKRYMDEGAKYIKKEE